MTPNYRSRWATIGLTIGLIGALTVQPTLWLVSVLVVGFTGAGAFVGREVSIRRSKVHTIRGGHGHVHAIRRQDAA
jgi:hypothetical protein